MTDTILSDPDTTAIRHHARVLGEADRSAGKTRSRDELVDAAGNCLMQLPHLSAAPLRDLALQAWGDAYRFALARFDHDAHVDALEAASNELYTSADNPSGRRRRAMAGACGRAAAIHRQLQSRVAHALQVVRRLERLLAKLEASAPIVTGDKPIDMRGAAREVRRAVSTLRDYVAQPDAPWISPAPVMFPRTTDEDT